ncbi:UNVERIFIED_CONTAM: hypothetical protein FKN15_067727 [Acipenser sinensis]
MSARTRTLAVRSVSTSREGTNANAARATTWTPLPRHAEPSVSIQESPASQPPSELKRQHRGRTTHTNTHNHSVNGHINLLQS